MRILRVVHFSTETKAQCTAQIAKYDQDPNVDAVLIDSRIATTVGGTGVAFDWAATRKAIFLSAAAHRRVVAGGLTPENVAEAVATLRPWGVDVVSGVEAAQGRKDPDKVRGFVDRAKAES